MLFMKIEEGTSPLKALLLFMNVKFNG